MKTFWTPLGNFDCYDEGTIPRALQAGQWWDVHLRPTLDAARLGWALDLGAHIGWFTVYLAQRHQRVVAVEPYPSTFQWLDQNLRRWHAGALPYTSYWPVAAYSHPCYLQFATENERTDPGGWSFVPVPTTEHGVVRPLLPAVALDDYLPPDAPVTLIKADCQGADLRALRGLTLTIARCRPLIVFEWEEGMAAWHGDTWEDYLRFFHTHRYTVTRISESFWDYEARPL